MMVWSSRRKKIAVPVRSISIPTKAVRMVPDEQKLVVPRKSTTKTGSAAGASEHACPVQRLEGSCMLSGNAGLKFLASKPKSKKMVLSFDSYRNFPSKLQNFRGNLRVRRFPGVTRYCLLFSQIVLDKNMSLVYIKIK